MVPAAEAVELGLFDRVVPHATLGAETAALAHRWSAMAQAAVRKAKQALYQSERCTLEEMLDLEFTDQQALFATPEARQLIRNR
jgi:enoyl-CoA hydratase/carnithine racemase